MRSIVITSGKGGVGKTTLTANLGKALSRLGNRVVLMDTDIGLNNLDVLMGIENKIVYDLVDVVQNRCRVKQALLQDPLNPNLFVLPSSKGYSEDINGQNIKAVIRNLEQVFDYVLVDSPAGIELGFHRAVASCKESIVVTTPHISALRDALKVIKLLYSYKMKVYVIINRCRGDLMVTDNALDLKSISEFLGIDPIGIIPDDDTVNQLSNIVSITSNSPGLKAIEMTAKNIHLGTHDILDIEKKYRGFLGSIKRKFKRMG